MATGFSLITRGLLLEGLATNDADRIQDDNSKTMIYEKENFEKGEAVDVPLLK
jgi:hypothetical protein